MSFQENTKKEKYKLPLQGQFTFHAFHPKAVNGIPFFERGSVWQVFWLGALAPSHSIFVGTVVITASPDILLSKEAGGPYSYGDSS